MNFFICIIFNLIVFQKLNGQIIRRERVNEFATAPKDANCGTYQIDPEVSYQIMTPFFQFGLNYPSSNDCTWNFHGTNGCNLPIISCESFKVVQSANCSTDYLEISDGDKGSEKFCGTSSPQNMTTGISFMKLKFKSGVFSTDKGFKCLVSCAKPDDKANLISNALSPPETADCECGIPGKPQRIVGGEEAPRNYWKWHAGLVLRGRKSPFCGASLINDRFVLTAAHCVVTTGLAAFPAAAEVVLNDYDITKANETVTIKRNILAITVSPFYNSRTQDYDVAMIEFSPPINLTLTEEPYVTPVCLPKRNDYSDFVDKNGTVIGWGVTMEDGDQPGPLNQVQVPIITNEECNIQYKNKITPRMLCAGFKEGKKDSCQGDSGGSMSLERMADEERFMQIGIVSWGEGCARPGKSGVYTRVTEINDWIRQIAKESTWCKD